MTHGLARHDGFARPQVGRVVHKVAAIVVLGCFLGSGPVRAQEGRAVEPAPAAPAAALIAEPVPPPAALSVTPPPPPNPALDLRGPTPEPAHPSIFHRWWFWTAVGAAAAATVAVIVISSRGHAPPATDLGNQEFQP
jgi:hypothetical protein